MQIQVDTQPIENLSADALGVICFEAEEAKPAGEAVASPAVPDPDIASQSGWLAELRSSGEFAGKLYETAILYHPHGLAAKRLVVIGGGKREKFSTVEARRTAGALVRTLKPKGAHSLALLLPEAKPEFVTAAAEGAVLGDWEPNKYKTDPKKNEKQIDAFSISVPADDTGALTTAAERGRIVAEAQNFTRALVNEPANRLAPADLAEAARQLASEFGLECEILDRDTMSSLGMGALLGVAQGSNNPPFLIMLKYRPSVTYGEDHLALVGKGVTFDTGGVSIKPSEGMEHMKFDMAGAAAVLGAMRALVQLKPAIAVTAYVPTVENMVSGNALRPGDILTSLSGKTIEVLNTDAEGRLILADAVSYAKRNSVTHIVDAATLTGAIGIALGHHNIGAFTNDEPFLQRVLRATRAADEKTWPLPMDDEYKDYLKSAVADLPNIGGRYGGSITAAWFIREFADCTPWVHLDIAATAWIDEAKAWLSKGPTGVGVRSFIELATSWNTAG